MSGYLLHQDSQRVVIVTDGSSNAKTGSMLQVWILAAADDPIATIRAGKDSTICGDCKHAGQFGERTCYVNVVQAPLTIWRAWKRGSYPYLPKADYARVFTGRMVRWGAYGDPSYIPLDVVRWASFFAKGWTGYTHQWLKTPEYREFLMASVDSEEEYRRAKSLGWRTFRVRSGGRLAEKEISCPASEEMGHRTQCQDCGLCNGVRFGAGEVRKDIAIVVHGVGRKNFVGLGEVKTYV